MIMPRRLAGLFALLVLTLSVVSPVLAQALSGALPTENAAIALITPPTGSTTISMLSAATQDTVIFSDPAEVETIEYDSAGSGYNGPTVAFTYSDSKAGPFVAAVDTLSSSYLSSVTFNNTPTSGANVKLFPAKWAKGTLTANGPGTTGLKRLTAMRKRLDDTSRPVAYVDTLIPFPALSGLALTNNTSSALQGKSTGEPFSSSGEIIGFFLVTSGAGTKKVQLRYSNVKAGPYTAWEDQGSIGHQNEVSTTAITAAINMRPFKALYWKLIDRNEAGATRTTTSLTALRRSQDIR